MFELETAITDWKQTFDGNEAVSTADVSELESHLRESVSELSSNGLSQREAFLIGTDRLGHPFVLEQEYVKVDSGVRWRRRAFWMLAGYVAMTFVQVFISAIVAITGTGLAFSGVGGSAAGVTMIVMTLLVWSVILVLAVRWIRKLDSLNEQMPAKWMLAIGSALVVAPMITYGVRCVQLQLVSPSWFGEAYVYLNLAGWAINICIVAICFIAMCKFSTPEVATVE